MTSPTELMNMPGFGADLYRKIAPYVTALPLVNAAINVCTAPGPVLDSLAEDLNGEYTNNPELLVSNRKSGCFPDIATLTAVMTPAVATKIAGLFTETSIYFRLTTRVTLGTTEFTVDSLLKVNNQKVTPLLRTFGTL
jgi:type II secretory pathway component PulK